MVRGVSIFQIVECLLLLEKAGVDDFDWTALYDNACAAEVAAVLKKHRDRITIRNMEKHSRP
jgi:hypothetical protein